MAAENSVILHGIWASPYVKRIELGLKLKGIPFQYVEQDLKNKSELLLKYNPVYKKVPVLVHNGKPIVESLIILEYIDETWKTEPRLFPEDPFQRAQLRFWACYIQKVLESYMTVFTSEGEEALDKACKDMFGKLDVLEEGIKSLVWRSINGDGLDVVDIMMVATLGPFRAQEEALGIKILDPNIYPFIYQRVTFLNELSVVKEITPPHHELVSLIHTLKHYATNP